MAEEDNYTAASMPPSFNEFDYSSSVQHLINPLITTTTITAASVDGNSINNSRIMVDYMLNDCPHPHPPPPHPHYSQYYLLSHRQSYQHDDDDDRDNNSNNHHSGEIGPVPDSITTLNRYINNNNSFGADVMQFADFGPRLALTHTEEEQHHHGADPNNSVNYFLKFPVLNHHLHHHRQSENDYDDPLITTTAGGGGLQQEDRFMTVDGAGAYDHYQTCYVNVTSTTTTPQQNPDDNDNIVTASAAALSDHHHHQPVVQLDFLAQPSNNNNNTNTNTTSCSNNNNNVCMVNNVAVEALPNSSNVIVGGGTNGKTGNNNNNKRKRPRTLKTTEEVESQRMTHIAVERNRRKQMNEHLRVLRSLMPSSYVQRGDQASIIGGAIEFVRELEQLLQCLESQKRRRLYGDAGGASAAVLPIDPTSSSQQQPPPQPQQLNVDPTSLMIDVGGDHDEHHPQALQQQLDGGGPVAVMLQAGGGGGIIREEVAENKSCVADVEVKLLGFDALIKILSRRRPGQLIRAISALQEDLQFSILHTNITTIEQTVLYSFNVKISSEQRFTADDIATSVQQIFTFIHANSSCNNSM